MKKLFSLLCMAACVFSLAACGAEKNQNSQTGNADINEEAYLKVYEIYVSSLSEFTEEDFKTFFEEAENYPEEFEPGIITMVSVWQSNQETVGTYEDMLETSCRVEGDTVVVAGKVDYSLRDANIKITFDKKGAVAAFSIDPVYTLGEKMSKAGQNTLIGIGVVFAVLILISLLISCFKFINKAEAALKNKKENNTQEAAEAVDNTIAQIVQKEEEELVDDLELVAVISAAVAAYTGSSTDGFVVRSIKKSNKKRWQNA